MRHQNSPEHLHAAHSVGRTSFSLTFGDGHKGATKGFREVGAEDKAHGADPGDKGVDVDILIMAEQRSHAVYQVLAAVEDQQNQHQIRDAANNRGVAFAEQCQPFQR